MFKNLILIFVLFSLSLSSCNTQSNKGKTATLEAAEPQHTVSESLQLNHGQKWKVDPKMMVYLRKMEKEVQSFRQNNNTDYALLAKNLQANIELLTTQCSMKGAAHDELHKWLVPFIEVVNVFSKEESETQMIQIEKSFLVFHQYFN